LQKEYNFITIDGELPINEIHQKIKDEVKKVLDLGVVG
jgi:thymidylate kinase